MIEDLNLFCFGSVLWVVSVLVIFNLVKSHKEADDIVTLEQVHPVKYAYVIDTEEEKGIDDLYEECLRLQEKLNQQPKQVTADFRHTTFEQLQTLLTNYPTVRKVVQEQPDLPAKNLLPLFNPLDNILDNWGYEPIGSPLEQVPYNPELHQPDSQDIAAGELVYIWFVGYRDRNLGKSRNVMSSNSILYPALVSRTLPSIPTGTKSYVKGEVWV